MIEFFSGLAAPWADFFGGSTLTQGLVTFLHVGGMLAAGGLALAADRATFRMSGRPLAIRREHLRELAQLHRPVLVGLAVVVISGLALAAADVETFLPSWFFWLKMAVFGVLLANGLILRSVEGNLEVEPENEGGWRRLRHAAARSASLWGILLLLGVLLPLEA